MGLGHAKISTTLRKDIAQHLQKVVLKIAKASSFTEKGSVICFAARLASRLASLSINSSVGVSSPSFLRPGEVGVEIRSFLDSSSLGNLIAASHAAFAAFHRPSLAKAAGDAAVETWSRLLMPLLKDVHLGLSNIMRRASVSANWPWVDIVAELVGVIARVALHDGAEKAVDKLLPRMIRKKYDRGMLERMLVGRHLTKKGEGMIMRQAKQMLPWLVQAEIQAQVRMILADFLNAAADGILPRSRRVCRVRRRPTLLPRDLHVSCNTWREASHPSSCTSFMDMRCCPDLCHLLEQRREELKLEFHRLWHSCRDAFKPWERNGKWLLFGTHLFGAQLALHSDAAPIAARLAEETGATICGYSVLMPGAHIKPHREDPLSAAFRVHVGLQVPKKTGFGLRVEEQIAILSESTSLLFSSASIHEAWNFTDELRVILLLDYGAANLQEQEWPEWMLDVVDEQEDILDDYLASNPLRNEGTNLLV